MRARDGQDEAPDRGAPTGDTAPDREGAPPAAGPATPPAANADVSRAGRVPEWLACRPARRVLLVGGGASTALDECSDSGRRLQSMMRGTPFDVVDLVTAAGQLWVPGLATWAAHRLYEDLFAGREVCLLGYHVLHAFTHLSPAMDMLVAAPPFSLASPTVPNPAGGWARAMVWWAPHPIDRNRWWDEPANRAAGEAFFGYVLGRLEFPARPEMPAPSQGLLDLVLDEMQAVG